MYIYIILNDLTVLNNFFKNQRGEPKSSEHLPESK